MSRDSELEKRESIPDYHRQRADALLLEFALVKCELIAALGRMVNAHRQLDYARRREAQAQRERRRSEDTHSETPAADAVAIVQRHGFGLIYGAPLDKTRVGATLIDERKKLELALQRLAIVSYELSNVCVAVRCQTHKLLDVAVRGGRLPPSDVREAWFKALERIELVTCGAVVETSFKRAHWRTCSFQPDSWPSLLMVWEDNDMSNEVWIEEDVGHHDLAFI